LLSFPLQINGLDNYVKLFERFEGWAGLIIVGFFMGFGLARTEWCGPLFCSDRVIL
jgi:hypothetical protein